MATAAARSPSPGQARPCCAMRRSADSNPFKPADCPQRSASSFSKGVGVCGCHASPRRRSIGEKENDAGRTPKAARPSGSKNFMSPTISATSKAVAASPSPRKKVLGERNEETHLFAPFSPANLAHKPKGPPPPEAGSARRLRLSFDGPAPAPPAPAPEHGTQRSFGEEGARMENHHHAAADSVDAEPPRAALYDPKTNYTSPRPQYLLYTPNRRLEMYRDGSSVARRLDEGLASESSEESVTTTTDDDLAEEEQEQVQQQIPEEPSALAAPSEAGDDAAAVPAAVLPLEPARDSPRAPVLTSEPAVMSPSARVLATEPGATSPPTPVVESEPAVTSPPARVMATEPRAISPRTRALTPEPELGVSSAQAPGKKRSSLRFMFPLALILCAAAAFVYVSPPDSPIMSNPALSKVSNFLSVQELHPVELAAWLKQWSSSSLDSITSYWEALASTQEQEQEYFGLHFSANLSAASADADHGADFYYNFAEAWSVPSEEPVGASVLEEQSNIQDCYKVVEELDVEISEKAPGSNGSSFLEEQLNIQDLASASNTDLSAHAEGDVVVEEESIDAAVAEESEASDYYRVAEELDLEISEEAPDGYGEEEMTSFSQDLDIPSEPTGEPEQEVERDESEDDYTNGKEGQQEYRGLKSDSSMWPSYLDKVSKPAAAGVALLVVLLSAGIAFFSTRKQTQVASNVSAPAEEPEQPENQSVEDHHLVKPSQSVSGSSEGHLVRPSQFQSPLAQETEKFGDSAFSQHSSSLSSGQGRRRKAKEEESLGLEPTSRRESTAHSTSSYGSFTTFEKISAKKKNKEDEAMTPVRRSSRLQTVKSPEA
uniref:Uncharacterized protein n=1 Tax=Avena sativa TaxID=4498 RepID=A0ACD5X5H6_AVESA